MSREANLSLLEHVAELRSRLTKAALAIVVCSVAAFIFRNTIFDILVEPYESAVTDRSLVFFRPTEAFSLFMRLSFFGGLVLASPVVLWQLWAFVSPGLHRKEKKYIIPAAAALTVLFLSGVLVGYWSLERGLGFLLDFGADRVEPVIGGNDYFTFAMRFMLVFGLAFEFPVFLFLAASVGVVGSKQLRKGRRWTVLLIVTIGAVITPSGDPLTLLLLSVPLYVLYEVTILLVRFILKK